MRRGLGLLLLAAACTLLWLAAQREDAARVGEAGELHGAIEEPSPDVDRAALVEPTRSAREASLPPAAERRIAAATGIVRGIVVDREDRPVAGARVSLHGALGEVITGPDGAFERPVPAAQKIRLRAVVGRRTFAVADTIVAPGGEQFLWLRPAGSWRVTGCVYAADGAPVAGICVQICAGRDEVGLDMTDEQGRFAFELPGPGAHRLEVHDQGARLHELALHVHEAQRLLHCDVHLPERAEIAGLVLATGEAPLQETVLVTAEPVAGNAPEDELRRTKVARDGRFRLQHLVAGTSYDLTIELHAKRRRSAVVLPAVPAGRRDLRVEIDAAAREGASIELEFVDSRGQRIRPAGLRLYRADSAGRWRAWDCASQRVDAGGASLGFDGLPPGEKFVVRVDPPFAGPGPVRFESAFSQIDGNRLPHLSDPFVAGSAARLQVRIDEPARIDVATDPGCSVECHQVDLLLPGSGLPQHPFGQQGRANWFVSPGRYRLRALDQRSREIAATEVQALPGATLQVGLHAKR